MCKLTKKCTSCFEEKELEAYTNNKKGSDRRHSQCKVCLKNKIKVPPKTTEKGEIFCNFCNTVVNEEESHSNTKCKKCQKEYYEVIKNKIKILPESGIKMCASCKLELNISNFHKNTYSRDGLNRICKKCNQDKTKKYVDENPEKVKERRQLYSELNREYINEKSRVYYNNNRDKCLATNKIYKENNLERIKEISKECYKKRYAEGKIQADIKRRLESDPKYKLKKSFYSLINKIFKGNKSQKTAEILGCSLDQFKQHIESQFLNWMNWDNYGNCESNEYSCSWHLDHIVPLNYAQTEEELFILNHWSNFQPLCSKINREKWYNPYPLTNLEIKIGININGEVQF